MTEDGASYPDGLTPGERRVLDYVREGTLDAEIGVRMGIPVGEVKDRIGRIVQKLGLRDRRDLVRVPVAEPAAASASPRWSWARPGSEVIDFTAAEAPDPDEPVIGAAGEPDQVIDFAPAPELALPSRRRRWLFALVATLAVLAVTAGSLALFAATRETGGVNSSAPAPTAIGTSGTIGTPGTSAATAGLPTVLIPKSAAVKDMPRDTVLYVETGCAQCDSGPDGVVRVWGRHDGSYEVETMFSAPKDAEGKRLLITGIAVGPGGQEIGVGVCSVGNCGAVRGVTAKAQTTIYRSLNGGVTWEIIGTLDGAWEPVVAGSSSLVDEGGVLARVTPATSADAVYLRLPKRSSFSSPVRVRTGPFSIAGWQNMADYIIGFDGEPILDTPLPFVAGWVEPTREGYWLAVGDSYLRILRAPAGVADLNKQNQFELSGRKVTGVARAAGGVDLGMVFANVSTSDADVVPLRGDLFSLGSGGGWPAWIDTNTPLVFWMVRPFIDMPPGRNKLLASATGRFVRVHDTGDCLNIRVEPKADARILDCVFDGTLLKRRDDPTPAEGYTPVNYGSADFPAWVTSAYVED